MRDDAEHVFRIAPVGLYLFLFVAAGAAAAAQPRAPERVFVEYTRAPIRVDGEDREWRDVEPLRLERREQLVDTGHIDWQGPSDASAQIRLLYDEAHLYVCARILDADPMVQRRNETFESGDVLELFFDCDLTDAPQGTHFDEDDLQLMLLPHSRDRPWAAIDPGARDVRGSLYARGVDRGFTGIEVARVPFDGGILLEAAIPLHNLPRLAAGTPEIGFNIAFGDKDPDREVYHYLAWTGSGSPASSTDNFGRIVFAGPPILEPLPGPGSDLTRTLGRWLPFLLPAAFVLLWLLVARSVIRRSTRRRRTRRVIGVAALLVVTGAFFLPQMLVTLRANGSRRTSSQIAGWIQQRLQTLENGSLGTLAGASRDEPLVDLLSGRSFQPPVDYEFQALAQLVPEAMRRAPTTFARSGVEIHAYEIPLTGSAARLLVTGPVRGDDLVFVVSQAADPERFAIETLPRIRVDIAGSADRDSVELTLSSMPDDASSPDRLAYFGSVSLTQEVRELAVEALAGRGLRLEGIAHRPKGVAATARPLLIGSVSRLGPGVPTRLVGPYPRDAAIVIAPETNWHVRLPAVQRDVGRIWLLLEAVDGDPFRRTTDGAIVGRVLAGRSGEPKPRMFDLRHQIELFADTKDANPELQRLGTPGHAQVAYEWEEHDGATRISPGFDLRFAKRRHVQELTIVNSGSYAFVLRAIVFARPKARLGEEPDDSPLVAAEDSGELRLADDAVRRLSQAEFFVFRDGALSATSLARAPPSLGLPSEAASMLASGTVATARDRLLPSGSFETYVPVQGDGWGDVVLAVVVRDAGLEDFERKLDLLSLLLASIGLPWLLVFLLETLAPAGSLRMQLTGTIVLSTVVPLVALSLFLVNRLEHDQHEKDRNGLLEGLRIAEARLDEARHNLQTEARASARQLAEEAYSRLRAVEAPRGQREPAIREKLRELLALARPEGWARESFLAVEVPHPDEEGRVLRVLDCDESRMLGETPLGPDSSVYLRWGRLFVGARADLISDGARPDVRVARGRVIDDAWLTSWGSRGVVAAFDLHGYPIAAGGRLEPGGRSAFLAGQARPGSMRQKAPLIERLRESPGPLVAEIGGDREWLGAFTLVRDRGNAPLALLGVLERPHEATLPLFFGNVGVRPFFIAVAGLLLVLAIFLTLTVTDRISKPIERLEDLAHRLSRGDLDVEVAHVPGADEVASLNRAFGVMAAELRERISQQEKMNRAMARLNTGLKLESVVGEAVRILSDATEADAVVLLLQDRETGLVHGFGTAGEPRCVPMTDRLAGIAFRAAGRFSLPLPIAAGAGWPELEGEHGLVLAHPMWLKERQCGAALLVFDRRDGPTPDAAFVDGLLAQIVAAIETARLYGLAIEDAVSGLFVKRYFRRRLAQEVDRSQRSSDRLSVLRLTVRGDLRAQWGDAFFDTVLGRIGFQLSEELPEHALAGRTGLASFEILLPGVTAGDATKLGRRLRGMLSDVVEDAAPDARFAISLGVAAFPEDARSTEFLLAELDRRSQQGSPEAESRAPATVTRGRAVFRAPAMLALLDQLDKAARTDLSLLIEGETGSGKEVVVDLCHAASARSDGPLVKVNCVAIPASLLESELFGHERGAFTGAVERKLGFFEQAHRGTLFLDEIGELPFGVQAKLLRVLQDGKVTRLGGRRPVAVDVRLVAATHRDLREMIRDGTFREDLYYRLEGVSLRLPPLRERKEEIPLLVEHFRREFSAGAKEMSAAALDALYRYHWPGNVRELENVVRRAMVLAPGIFVEPEDLDLGPEVVAEEPAMPRAAGPGGPARVAPGPGQDDDPEVRWRRLKHHLETGDGSANASVTPRVYRELVGVSRRTASRDLTAWLRDGRLGSRGQRRSLRYFLAEKASSATA